MGSSLKKASQKKIETCYASFDRWVDSLGRNEVARLLGLRPLTVWHWRAHKNYPKVEHMQKIKRLTKGRVTYDMIIDRKLSPTGIR